MLKSESPLSATHPLLIIASTRFALAPRASPTFSAAFIGHIILTHGIHPSQPPHLFSRMVQAPAVSPFSCARKATQRPPALVSAGSPYRQLEFSAIQLLHLTLPLSHHPGRSAPSLPSACFQKVWMALNLGGYWVSSTAHLENPRTRRPDWATLGQVD